MAVNPATMTTRLRLVAGKEEAFCDWQARLRGAVSQALGFISLEVLTPEGAGENCWIVTIRFDSKEHLEQWRSGAASKQLRQELWDLKLLQGEQSFHEEANAVTQANVTQAYITFADPSRLSEYHQWHEKVHKMEAAFPGFQKVYLQAPEQPDGAWVTLLEFDTVEHLEKWLNSPQRLALMEESKGFVKSRTSQRLYSSFGGWFHNSAAPLPARWKQSMMVLLILYPLVMMQYSFLDTWFAYINTSVRTFVFNSINVTLMAWPLMPLTIWALQWWISTREKSKELLGVILLGFIYILEVLLFWYFNTH